MTRIAYDADAFVKKLRQEQQDALEDALSKAPDEKYRASILAQASLFPAFEACQVALIGMREAERPDGFIAMIFGAFAGQLLDNVRVNADDQDLVLKVFFEAMGVALSGRARGSEFVISVPGVMAGTA